MLTMCGIDPLALVTFGPCHIWPTLYQFQKSLSGKSARFKQRSFPRVHVLHRYRRRLHQSISSENGITFLQLDFTIITR